MLFASHCTLVLPPCASMCHYSGTSEIRNTKNHVLIREVPLITCLYIRPVYKGGFYFCGTYEMRGPCRRVASGGSRVQSNP